MYEKYKNKLPQGWVECQLGEVFNIVNGDRGKNYPAKNKLHASGIPFVSAINIQNSKLFIENLLYLNEQQYDLLRSGKINKGDTLLCIRGSIGKHCIYPFNKGAIASSMVIIRKILPNIDKFLFYYLESFYFRQEVKKYDNGTAQPNLSASDLKRFNYLLPPLNEQKRIVEKIESEFAKIDEGLEHLLKAKEQIKQYRQSVLKSAFEGKLTQQNPDDEPAEILLQKINSKTNCAHNINLPQGWIRCKLGEAFNIERGGSPRPIKEYLTSSKDGINWIKIGDTKNTSKYIFETKEKIKPEGIRHSRFVAVGDLILSNSMSFGRPYIMKTSGCIHDGWVVFRNQYKIATEEFLYYMLSSQKIYSEFSRVATGSTVKNLNIDRIKGVNIIIPPLNEQKRIVEEIEKRFAVADEAEKVVEDSIEKAKQLKQSILKKAFEGRLVSQDPNDEPASKLLEKIKQERNKNDRK